MRGLEPPRCHHHRLLRPARLPVPPHPLTRIHYANGLGHCQESISYGDRYDNTKPGAIPTGSPIPGAHGRYSSRFCICLPTCISQPQLVAAIAPIIAIHSSITNNEPVIVEIPMTTGTKAVAPGNISYASSARSTSVPASISGVVAVYKLAALIILVAENPTAAMTSSAALAQSCGWKNHGQQYSQNDH